MLKGPSPVQSRFWYHKKAHIFLITHGKFNSWKVFFLEDINEYVPAYGNHNSLHNNI